MLLWQFLSDLKDRYQLNVRSLPKFKEGCIGGLYDISSKIMFVESALKEIISQTD